MKLSNCYNYEDYRKLARQKLPAPIFHYIDGGADDEVTLKRNTEAFNDYDLIPNVLTGIESVDLGITVLGKQLKLPFILSPAGMPRLMHYRGEWAIAKVAEKFGTMYGLSTVGTVSIEDMGAYTRGPKLFQMYVHKDPGLTSDLIARCKESKFDALAITVDTIVAGNRERDYATGMTTPPRLTLNSLLCFSMRPAWLMNYLLRNKFELPNVSRYVSHGSSISSSVVDYINNQLDKCISWNDAEKIKAEWDGPFLIKGIMSVADARKAVEIGADAIMISNHGGRQLDGGRAPFDQLASIADAVGDSVEIILDGGVRRGTHVLKALAMGATACSGARYYLYALAAGGEAGLERAMTNLHNEIERDMMLMGCRTIRELDRSMLAKRP